MKYYSDLPFSSKYFSKAVYLKCLGLLLMQVKKKKRKKTKAFHLKIPSFLKEFFSNAKDYSY